ncbi:MAG TPA: thiamine pyrophosphate-dependent enzyme [Vineibacter sp.]|nr:thiamine pyrophosphate-dependent enzyme [Vineibacter sp.]
MSMPDLHRRAVVEALMKDAGDDLLVIAGLGQSAWDITAAGDRPQNLPLWGGMGGAAMIGLGLALAQPRKRVLVITGDGEMLMGLGSLATIAAQRPANLVLVVLDNEKFGETGNQATHTAPATGGMSERGAGTDLAAVVRGCGIADSATITQAAEIAALARDARDKPGPIFRVAKVKVEDLPAAIPPKDGAYLKDRFRQVVLGAT